MYFPPLSCTLSPSLSPSLPPSFSLCYRTAPIGEGGYAFFTDSAKDIAATITQRKEARLQARSKATAPSPTRAADEEEEEEEEEGSEGERGTATENTIAQHPKQGWPVKLQPTSSSGEREPDHSSPTSPERSPRKKDTGRQPSLQRKCARRNRVIPMSHRLEKERSQLKLKLDEQSQTSRPEDSLLSTPDEPHFMTTAELAGPQRKFREWLRRREEEKARAKTSPATPMSPRYITSRRPNFAKERSSSVSTPDREENRISDMSSLDGGYVTIRRYQYAAAEEEERDSVSSITSQGKLRGLERQRKMDVPSPNQERGELEFIGMRPRTNAFLDSDQTPPLTPPTRWRRQHQLASKQQSLDSSPALSQARESSSSRNWQCDGTLAPRAPNIASTQQKSGSDPQLSNRLSYELTNSAGYLIFVAPSSQEEAKKTPKKPKPTPRLHRQAPESLPTHQSTFFMTPPTPPPGHPPPVLRPSPSSHQGLDVRVLLSSQRSLSESNLFNLADCCGDDSQNEEYVEMCPWKLQKQPLYVNQDQMEGEEEEEEEEGEEEGEREEETRESSLQQGLGTVTLRRGMRRLPSRSVGDIPTTAEAEEEDKTQPLYENTRACAVSLFLQNEQIYENGPHIMNYLLYGDVSVDRDDEEDQNHHQNHQYHGHHRGTTAVGAEVCGYRDSGLGSTPSCSPLLAGRSFSLNDVRQPPANSSLARQKMGCTKAARGQEAHHTRNSQLYENLPLIMSS